MKQKLFFEAALTTFLFASIPLVVKAMGANAISIGIARIGLALFCLFLFPSVRFYLRKNFRANIKALLPIGLLFGLHWLTYFWSIKISSASVGILGLSSYGLFLILFGNWFGGEKLTPLQWLAVVVAVLGNFILVPEFSLSNNTTLGLAIGLVSGAIYAVLPLLHKKHPHIPTSVRAFGQFLFALIPFMFFAPTANWNLSSADWLGLVYLGIGGTLIAHTLWVKITTNVTPITSSLLYYTTIPITMLLSFLLLDEAMTNQKLLGAGFIVAANLLGVAAKSSKNPLRQ